MFGKMFQETGHGGLGLAPLETVGEEPHGENGAGIDVGVADVQGSQQATASLAQWWEQNNGPESKDLSGHLLIDLLVALGFTSQTQQAAAKVELDEDGNGHISFGEASGWLGRQDAASTARWVMLQQIWNAVDEDGSGHLDRAEAREVLQKMGYATYADKKAAIRELDSNGDGRIDFNEFCAWFAKQDPERQQELHLDRGTRFKIGSQDGTARMSAHGEAAVVLARLRFANEENDVMMMDSAVEAAHTLFALTEPSAEAVAMLEEVERRLADDEDLRRIDRLFRSEAIQVELSRLWDLMVVESQMIAAATEGSVQIAEGEVTLAGYQQMHIRLSIAISEKDSTGSYAGRDDETGEFDPVRAAEFATLDWNSDMERFAEASHITAWLDKLRLRFRQACSKKCQVRGFRAVFARHDEDGSGGLEFEEFVAAVRNDLEIAEVALPGDSLRRLFSAVDTDGSGSVDASEFVDWLWSDKSAKGQLKLVDNRRKMMAKGLEVVKQKFIDAAEKIVEMEGWKGIFDMFDDDGSGELDEQEFTAAIRKECDLSAAEVSDDDISELFTVVDVDASGGICSAELTQLLTASTTQQTMTRRPFYSSIFELATLWVQDKEEENDSGAAANAKSGIVASRRLYVQFLQGLFSTVGEYSNACAKSHSV